MQETYVFPISVIMPVFNTPVEFLAEAVESILNQTFTEYEFLIIDDCSTSRETTQYLSSLHDPRVRVIRNKENLGITKSLNIGIRNASGKYIARMDADDVSLSHRFAEQYKFMEAHPDAVLCGSSTRMFGIHNWTWSTDTTDQDMYRIRLLFWNVGPAHPSVMYSREKLQKYGLWYDERLKYTQDYMMWVNASRFGKVYCMDEILVHQRTHNEQVSSAKAREQAKCGILIRREQLSRLIDHVSLQEAEDHKKYTFSRTITEESCRWFKKLIAANRRKKVYEQTKFEVYVTNMIAQKVYATYDIRWKSPESYMILLKYLPAHYVFKEIMNRVKT